MSDERQSRQERQYPKFRNGHAAREIRVGAREFNCIGVSPPQDHPQVYLNMGSQDTILCPYCSTRFRFDPESGPSEVNSPDSPYADLAVGDPLLSNAGLVTAGRTL
jgi:uncharacterized Zn-finger protein